MVQFCKASRARLSSLVLALGDPCEAADLSEELRGRVRAQQVLAIQRMTPALTLANIVNACALVLALQFSAQLSPAAALWAMLAVTSAVLTLKMAQRRRAKPFPASMRQETCNKVVGNAALFGVIWAFPGAHLLPATDGMAQAFVAALVTGMIGGGALALHPIPAAAIVFMVPVTAGGLLGVARTGDPALIGFVLIALSFFFVVARNILRHSEVFVSEFVGKLELEEKNRLVAQLLDETRSEAGEEKRRSERRLAQAQKMEAIGQLTGGMAHDFNNLLAAIQGHAELIQLEGKADPGLVAPIIGATRRGSDLVRRLLSVARKQALKPEPVNVGRLVSGMTPMLQRMLGAGIEIEARIDGGIWPAVADPGELEGAILNLALNARDAMPRGGRLLLECGNASAATDAALGRLGIGQGDFVQIAVRDSGCGMTSEVRERALEPFFTTKARGEGSGLGLSTTGGFIEQSGGHIVIESAPGEGTTVRLFLPRSAAVPLAPILQLPEPPPVQGIGETILIIEDDDDLRALVAGIVKTLNYRVRCARDAGEALRIIREADDVDLVLSDVVLPGGTSGIDLAGRLSVERPWLPVVLISGHPAGEHAVAAGAEACSVAGRPLLSKPFGLRQLAERVADALDTARDRQPAGACAPQAMSAERPSAPGRGASGRSAASTLRARPIGRRRHPS